MLGYNFDLLKVFKERRWKKKKKKLIVALGEK